MRRLAGVVLVVMLGLALGGGRASAQGSASSDVNIVVRRLVNGSMDATAIVAVLGEPNRTSGASRDILEFDTNGSVLKLFRRGDVYSFLGEAPAVQPDGVRQLSKVIDDATRAGAFSSAVRAAARCQGIKRDQCRSQIRDLLSSFQQRPPTTPDTITGIAELLETYRIALSLETKQPRNVLALLARSARDRYADDLRTAESNALLQNHWVNLTASLGEAATKAVTEIMTRFNDQRAEQSLPAANEAIRSGRITEGWDSVSSLLSPSAIQNALPQMSSHAASAVSTKLADAVRDGTVSALGQFELWLEGLPSALVSAEAKEAGRSEAHNFAKSLVTAMIPSALASPSAEASRLLQLKASALVGGAPAGTLEGLFEHVPLTVSITPSADPKCGIQDDALLAFISPLMPPLLEIAAGSGLVAHVGLSCESEDSVGSQQALPSSYTSGSQQFANPDYISAQSAVQQARVNLQNLKLEHALEPASNAWFGAAYGISEGLAVNDVSRSERNLANTPPFFERPVSTPYSAYKRTHTRAGSVTVKLAVTEAASRHTDSREVTLVGSSSSDEVTGVMPTDERALRNTEPRLPALSKLYPDVLELEDGEVRESLSNLLQSALVQRAVSTPSDQRVRRLGSLLLAFDIDGSGESVRPFQGFKDTLDAIPLSKLLDADFTNPRPPVVSESKAVAGTVAGASRARVEAVARALSATLTIRHSRGSGSGFVIRADGTMITNFHVVAGASRLTAITTDGDEYLVSVIATDALRDLALLRVSGWRGAFLELGSSDAISVGEEVIAVGTPMGLEGTATRGIVSAKRRINNVAVIQVDAAINPGNSGGPLLNEAGHVVGVTTWKLSGPKAESLGFAVSSTELLKAFATQLNPQ